MTDNEIIKALECCTRHSGCFNGTKNCPLEHYHYGTDCSLRLVLKALDLINRQKVEIKKLREENNSLKNGYFQKHYEEYEQQELCSLKQAWRQSQMDYIDLNAEWEGKYKTAKSEAIKEFAELLKKKTYPFPCAIGVENAVTVRVINDLVKEMTEG